MDSNRGLRTGRTCSKERIAVSGAVGNAAAWAVLIALSLLPCVYMLLLARCIAAACRIKRENELII